MSLVDKFKKACEGIKNSSPFMPQPPEELYSIYKRSLPVELNRPVVIGVTKKEAEDLLKSKLKVHYRDLDKEIKTVIYYDIVLMNEADPSVFNNPKEVVKKAYEIN